MAFMKLVGNFFAVLGKSLVFKHYLELGERDFGKAFLYFLTLLLVCFVAMLILLTPKFTDIASNLQGNSLSIGQFQIDAKLATKGPVMIPSRSPFLTLDTTGNKSMETERILVTDKSLSFNIWGSNQSVEFATYDFANSRAGSLKAILALFFLLLPGVCLFFYIAYLVKYLMILIPLCVVSFILSKIFKSQITLAQTMMLAFYASTPMVILEVLTAPFAVKQYLFSIVPFMGIQFSPIAIGIFFVFFVTAIRINGNRYVQRI